MNDDLISRAWLKKATENLVAGGAERLKDYYKNGSKSEENEWIGGVYDVWELIDNAPPVVLKPYFNVTFDKEELEQIIRDRVIEPIKNGELVVKEERPQGEWIIDGHHYKCSRCGKTLAIMFSETDDDDLIGCPFCLADMRVRGGKRQ